MACSVSLLLLSGFKGNRSASRCALFHTLRRQTLGGQLENIRARPYEYVEAAFLIRTILSTHASLTAH